MELSPKYYRLPKFYIYTGDVGELRTNKNYYHFKWVDFDGNANIIFSVTRQGNSANSHFTSDKEGLRKLRQAINDWCEFCFWLYPWCKMVIGIIEHKNIMKIAEDCGFKRVISFGKKHVYIRRP